MKIDINIINQIITTKNKNCKIVKIKCKNAQKRIKIGANYIQPTKSDKNIEFILKNNIDLFPFVLILKNKQVFTDISNYLSQKINSQITLFRSVKSITIVEYVAKSCVLNCIKADAVDCEKKLKNNFDILKFYKKELQIIPYLMLNNLLSVVYDIYNKLHEMYLDICIGAKQRNFIFYKNFSLARVYGIVKYNQNMLKYANISKINIKKCVFNFINKLTIYYKKLQLVFKMANNLIKYTNYKGQTFLI